MLIYLQVLAFVGDQFDFGEDVCGIVLTVRYNEDILCVWNRNSSDQQVFVPFMSLNYDTLIYSRVRVFYVHWALCLLGFQVEYLEVLHILYKQNWLVNYQ